MGATGHQGSSLVRAILNEGDACEFTIRALVRNVHSEKAGYLKHRPNVEVVQVNSHNEATLRHACKGVYGMYCVSFYYEDMSCQGELQQAQNMANAAKACDVKHVIWSTFEDSRKLLDDPSSIPSVQGDYKVPMCDAKGEADAYFRDIPTTYLLPSFYYENFIDSGYCPRKSAPGKWSLSIPMGNSRLPCIAAEDMGKCALEIFKRPNDYIGKRVGIISEALTGGEMAWKMAKALNRSVAYEPMTVDEYRHSGVPVANELANLFQFYQKCDSKLLANRNAEETRKLNPDVMSFEQWLAKHAAFMPVLY
jgi:uncharacterized protein YbjT (DUF2867 family)